MTVLTCAQVSIVYRWGPSNTICHFWYNIMLSFKAVMGEVSVLKANGVLSCDKWLDGLCFCSSEQLASYLLYLLSKNNCVMGSGSKQDHFVRCGSWQAGWSEPHSWGILAPDRMWAEGVCKSERAQAAHGWSELKSSQCCFLRWGDRKCWWEKKGEMASVHPCLWEASTKERGEWAGGS